MLVDKGQWEVDYIFEDHSYNITKAINCIVYYACGCISKKLCKTTACLNCLYGLKSVNTYVDLPAVELVNLITKGKLTHPNINLFYLLKKVEESLSEYCEKNIYFWISNWRYFWKI